MCASEAVISSSWYDNFKPEEKDPKDSESVRNPSHFDKCKNQVYLKKLWVWFIRLSCKDFTENYKNNNEIKALWSKTLAQWPSTIPIRKNKVGDGLSLTYAARIWSLGHVVETDTSTTSHKSSDAPGSFNLKLSHPVLPALSAFVEFFPSSH